MAKVPKHLMAEQYELKCSYISNGLDTGSYTSLFDQAKKFIEINGSSLDWSKSSEFGVPKEVLESVVATKINPAVFLCHPNLILLKPEMLRYYRCISIFSQKGLKTVSGVSSVEAIEAGRAVKDNAASLLAKTINSNLGPIYRVAMPSLEKLKAMMHATAGITLDGGWKNAIGTEGERIIKSIIVRHAFANKELVSVTIAQKTYPVKDISPPWIDKYAKSFKSAMFSNGSIAVFGSEPDVTLYDKNGAVVAGIEVKAGLDPAGALERLGAMLKSFDEIKVNAPNAQKILVVACITDEVEARLKTTAAVSRYYHLTDIIMNKKNSELRFANTLRGVLGLVEQSH